MTFLEDHVAGGPPSQSDQATLRDIVRAASASDHASLDASLAQLDVSRREDLVRFLGIHLAARAGIEDWLSRSAPTEWEPPSQIGLITEDLIALGGLPSAFPAPRFEPGGSADWLGPAYVLAGAHLGNRLLLAQAGAALPQEARRFLTGDAMQDYWRRLRSLLNSRPGPAGAHATVAGAKATFAHFAGCIDIFTEATLAVA